MKQGTKRAGQHLLGKAAQWFAMAMVGMGMLGATAFGVTHTTSTNIAVIPNYTGGGFGGGGAGTFNPGWFPGYTFTTLTPIQVQTNPAVLNGFDTVILYQFCNIASFPVFTSNLVSWVQGTGGKLLIWDSDSCSTSTSYAWLSPLGAVFDRFSPGQTGSSGGSLTIVDSTGFGSSDPSSPFYVNTGVMVSQTDAVGDLNVVNENTVSPVWCALMRGTNIVNRSGYAHMCTKVGGLTGAPDAIILYCGLDTDFISAPGPSGGGQIQKLFALEIAHGWGPPGSPEVADITCQAPVGNLVLTPPNATNQIGQTHTVIATVSFQSNSVTVPIPGATVSFAIISGPSAGTIGTGVTGTNGQCAFSWVSSFTGIDTVMASTTVNGLLKTYNATKHWVAAEAPNLVKYNFDTNVTIGQTLTYELTFDTFSNTVAAVGLVMVDQLPLVVDLVSFTTNGAVSAFYDLPTHSIYWDFGVFPPLTQGPTNYVTVQVNTNALGVTNILNAASLISSNLPPTITHDRNPRCPTCPSGVPLTPNRPPVAVCTNVIVAAGTNCLANASINAGSYDPDGTNDPITLVQVPPGPYSLGSNNVCLIVTDSHGATNTCCAVVTVVDTTPPTISCPANIVATNDPGSCSAVVSFLVSAFDACGGLNLSVDYPSGSAFPAGTTTVTATASDGAGNTNSCSFTVTVLDKEPPIAACRAAVNPGDKKIPVAGKDPKSGQNPDGYYQLLGKDNCDSGTNLVLYIHDTASGFIAGPFHSGDIIKLRQSPGGTPSSTPDSPPIAAQVRLNGDAALYAVDSSGNVSQPAYCFVPPPPK